MFEDFAGVWSIVGLTRSFAAGRLHPVSLAGERLVLFRDPEGTLRALIDRCPHRGVALSLGSLRDGCVECPFHGWRFDGEGRCRHVPWNPDAKRETLGAFAVPVREAGGLVWVYTGSDPADAPMVPESLLQPGVALCGQSVLWRVHWTRAMENMLDSPHLPFVHRGTIGRALAPFVEGRMDTAWEPVDFGARITNRMEGRSRPGRLDYRFPNAMELHIDPPGRTFRMLAVCHPLDDHSTLMTIYTLRSFARSRLLDPLFRWSNRRIAREDQAVLESSDPPRVPPAAEERSVRTDAPTLAFRRIWFDRLQGTTAVLTRS